MSSDGTNRQDGPIHVQLEVPNHDAFTEMMATLSETDTPFETTSIKPGETDDSSTVEIDMGRLTTTQRETLSLALEAGYYERPRDTTLGHLANSLDISKSAVSQRLRSAEIKLIKAALDQP